jgi:protein-tyrosine phosphatase
LGARPGTVARDPMSPATTDEDRHADIHFHLLPGVDDGAPDDDAALALARAAVADGTRVVVATPHVRFVVVDELAERVGAVRRLLRRAGIPLRVVPGGELNVDDVERFSARELALIAFGTPDRRWILLEPRFHGLGAFADAADELRGRGYEIVLAHPERCPALWEELLEPELDRGALAQVNASSLVGDHGRDARHRAWQLVRSRPDDVVIASDAHSAADRPPLLRRAHAALTAAGCPIPRATFPLRPRPADSYRARKRPRIGATASTPE